MMTKIEKVFDLLEDLTGLYWSIEMRMLPNADARNEKELVFSLISRDAEEHISYCHDSGTFTLALDEALYTLSVELEKTEALDIMEGEEA